MKEKKQKGGMKPPPGDNQKTTRNSPIDLLSDEEDVDKVECLGVFSHHLAMLLTMRLLPLLPRTRCSMLV